MIYLCLLLSGAALLVNGLALLGRISLRDSAVFSILIGSTQLALGLTYAGLIASLSPQLFLGASGLFLFGLTYMYIGLDVLLGLGSKGVGWFSGLVGGLGVILAVASFPGDPLLGVLWLCWAFLWMLSYVRTALGRDDLTPFNGWSLVLTSQITTTIPAFMGLLGSWPLDWRIAAGTGAVVSLLLVVSAYLGRVKRRGYPSPTHPLPGHCPSFSKPSDAKALDPLP